VQPKHRVPGLPSWMLLLLRVGFCVVMWSFCVYSMFCVFVLFMIVAICCSERPMNQFDMQSHMM
jgi:hypothetical protein